MQLCFQREDAGLVDITVDRKTDGGLLYRKLFLSIGRRQRIAPNHIVSAIAGRANIRGSEIGKVEIYDERAVVGVPADRAEAIERAMQGATICGQPVRARLSEEKPALRPGFARMQDRFGERREPASGRRGDRPTPRRFERPGPEAAQPRGRVKLSPEARARLLDTADLGRFELGQGAKEDRPRRHRLEDRRASRSERHGNRRSADRGASRKGRR